MLKSFFRARRERQSRPPANELADGLFAVDAHGRGSGAVSVRLSGEHRDAVFDHLMTTLKVPVDIEGLAERGEPELAAQEARRQLQSHRLLYSLGFVRGQPVNLELPAQELTQVFLRVQYEASVGARIDSEAGKRRARTVLAASRAVLVTVHMAMAGASAEPDWLERVLREDWGV